MLCSVLSWRMVYEITAHISGKMRMHYIKILPGDKVKSGNESI